MSDIDETLLDEADQNLPTIPDRRTTFFAPDGRQIKLSLQIPNRPAPVFHDTPLENHIDNDLSLMNTGLNNLAESWKAVRSLQDACQLQGAINNALQVRRKLANKQLGTERNSDSRGVIYHID